MSSDAVPPATTETFPALTLVLPGTWVQVPVRDRARVEQLLHLVEQSQGACQAEGWRSHLARLLGLGGDQVLVSTSEPTSVLVTSWPDATAGGTEELLAMAGRTADARVLPHRAGWPVVKLLGESMQSTAAAYWLAHPDSGRVLALEVSVDVPDFDHPRWRTLDVLVGELEWNTPEQQEAAGAVHR